MLYALSTGRVFEEYREEILDASGDNSYQNQFLAAAAASDIVMRSNAGKPNCFQLMFGECLNRHGVTKELKKLCSAFQLSPSEKFSIQKRSDEVLRRLENGLEITPRDFVFILVDNFGFKQLGKNAAFDQWSLVIPRIVREKELKAVVFYCDDPSKRISRKPSCIWDDAIADAKGDRAKINELIDSAVGIRVDDYMALGESVLEDIRIALEHAGLLRHNNFYLERICNKDTSEKWKQALRDALRQNNPSRHSAPYQRPTGTVVMPRDFSSTNMDLEPDTPDAKNKYEMSKASMEAMHQDLAQNFTQTKLMKYVVECGKNQVSKYDATNQSKDDERPVAEIMTALGVDGAPAATCQKQLAQNAIDVYNKYPKHMFVSAGGFHTVMKTLNASGELSEEMLTTLSRHGEALTTTLNGFYSLAIQISEGASTRCFSKLTSLTLL